MENYQIFYAIGDIRCVGTICFGIGFVGVSAISSKNFVIFILDDFTKTNNTKPSLICLQFWFPGICFRKY